MIQDPANKFFSPKVTPRDRAVFEAGIALGMVIHQFNGVPVRRSEDLEVLAEAIRRAVLAQPFRTNATVKLKTNLKEGGGPYDYVTIKTRDMEVCVETEYNGVWVKACLKHIDELDFNLAYIEDIEVKKKWKQ